ncbi:MAG TPA: universal stress protein [Halomicronema sp.]
MSFTKILVALDRSSQAPLVFERALNIAQKDNARLLVFHSLSWQKEGEVAPLMGTGMGLDPASSRLVRSMQQEVIDHESTQVREWLQSYSDKASQCGVSAEFHYKVGETSASICDMAHSWGADLIVVGRRGLRGISEILMGSVSNQVVHNAGCAVLIVQGN